MLVFRLFILASASILLACASRPAGESTAPRKVAGLYYPVSDQPDPSFIEIIKMANQSDRPTLEKTIELIHQNFQEYLDYAALVYKSRSLQKATFNNPRAILFGKTARTVIAYTGNGPSMEVMTFDESRGFEFREIAFAAEGGEKVIDARDRDAQYSSEEVLVSKANLPKCMDCHGYMYPRPIWDTYFIWPGVYGSQDEDIFNSRDNAQNRAIRTSDAKVEQKKFYEFLKNSANNIRYKYLYQSYREKSLQEAGGSNTLSTFTTLLYNHGLADIARSLIENPKLWPYRYAIAGVIGCNFNNDPSYGEFVGDPLPIGWKESEDLLKAFLPEAVYRWHQEKSGSFENILLRGERERSVYYLDKNKRMTEALHIPLIYEKLPAEYTDLSDRIAHYMKVHSKNEPEASFLSGVSGISEDRAPEMLEWLLKPLGVDMSSWPLNRSQSVFSGVVDFNDGGFSTRMLVAHWSKLVSRREPLELWNQLAQSGYYQKQITDEFCEELKQRSQAALK